MILKDLKLGDIIRIPAPFEENTRDYYNGYQPEEIRGEKFTDRFGHSYKNRMVIYMAREGKAIYYLPLTSKHGSAWDHLHQYELQDNSMTRPKDPALRSYVELDSLRTIKIAYDRDIPYIGTITDEDRRTIEAKLAERSIRLNSEEDQRGYIPVEKQTEFYEKLSKLGFKETENSQYRVKYEKEPPKTTITANSKGAVYYHVSKTKEEVVQMISRREGRSIRKRQLQTVSKPQINKQIEWEENNGLLPLS